MSWPLVKLSELFNVARGGSPRPIDDYLTEDSDGLNWVMIGDTKGNSKYIEKTKKKIKPEGLKKTRQVKPGDFLLSNSMSFGRPYILKTSGCIHDGWLVLSPLDERVDKNYLYYCLSSDMMYQQLASKAAGAVVKNINTSIVKDIKIPLPPLVVQKQIAAMLEKADSLRTQCQQMEQELNSLAQSVFLDMFGDPVKNPKDFPMLPIEENCSVIVDCVNRTAKTVEEETPYKMIRTTNIRNHNMNFKDLRYVEEDVYKQWTRRLVPQVGDVIFTREAPAGEAAVVETREKIFLGQRLMHYRTNVEKLNPYYFLYELMAAGIQRQINQKSTGSTVVHLSVGDCKMFKIRVPAIEQQNLFEKRIKEIRNNKNALIEEKRNLSELFASLMQRAFKGELDLKVVA